MPSAEELEQLRLAEEIKSHLDPYEISRLEEMETAKKNDPWKEEDGNLIGASEMG